MKILLRRDSQSSYSMKADIGHPGHQRSQSPMMGYTCFHLTFCSSDDRALSGCRVLGLKGRMKLRSFDSFPLSTPLSLLFVRFSITPPPLPPKSQGGSPDDTSALRAAQNGKRNEKTRKDMVFDFH